MSVVEVGRFKLDTETGTVTGPAEYMREAGNARLRSIEAGTDVVFNAGAGGLSPSPEVALLVSLQTDFAGWKGSRQFFAAMEAGRA